MENKSSAKSDTSPNQACNELLKFLIPLAEGELVPDFNNKLHDVVKAVRETGKRGSIALMLDITPSQGSVNQLIVHSGVKTNLPTPTKPMSLYFSDENGGLHRSDPRQRLLFNNESNDK